MALIDFRRSVRRVLQRIYTVRYVAMAIVSLTIGVSRPAAAQMNAANMLCLKQSVQDNAPLLQLAIADQSQRNGGMGGSTDAMRRDRALTLLRADSVRTIADFAHIALLLQHGRQAVHYLLAHEMASAAAISGCGGYSVTLIGFSDFRFLWSLGLDPTFIAPVYPSVSIQPRAADTVPLTMDLITREEQLAEALRENSRGYPEYAWATQPSDSSIGVRAAFMERIPVLATIFKKTSMTPVQYFAVSAAVESAIGDASFARRGPKPTGPVTGALARSPVHQRNMQFVRNHETQLVNLGLRSPLDAMQFELARDHTVPIPALPQDPYARTLDVSCGATAFRQKDNADLIALVKSSEHNNLHHLLELVGTSAIQTPDDFLNAAIALEHGTTPEEQWRAHELAVQAGRKGCGVRVLPLVAATEDRFLALLGLKQRFGTLPTSIAPIDDGPAAVNPALRAFMLRESSAH